MKEEILIFLTFVIVAIVLITVIKEVPETKVKGKIVEIRVADTGDISYKTRKVMENEELDVWMVSINKKESGKSERHKVIYRETK